ncbi:MAG TPA: tetratricopeptide repeat protein, partial [Bacteroidetes bacterium]|nr:tetratricopeptide repeat protein [Bacteroidota bacterium]
LLSGTDQFSVMLSDVNAAIATRIDAVQEQAEEKAPEVQPTRILNSAKPKSSRRLYMSIAASIMLLATIGFFVLGSSPTPQTIAEEYFQVFELGQTRAATSTSEGAYDQAKVLYQNKKFAEAAPLFDQVNSIKALYSAANCYYLLGKYDLASSRFRAVIDRGDGYAEDAEFGLAMTYLMQDKVEQADELLSNISQDNRHNYSLMAKDALEEIEHL